MRRIQPLDQQDPELARDLDQRSGRALHHLEAAVDQLVVGLELLDALQRVLAETSRLVLSAITLNCVATLPVLIWIWVPRERVCASSRSCVA